MMSSSDSLSEPLIHVCVNVDCALRGSENLRDKLRALVDDWDVDVGVNDYLCFAACKQGPNILVEHKRTFYCSVREDDLEGILRHALDGPPLSHIDRSSSFVARKIMNLLDAGLRPGDLTTKG